MGTRQRLKHMPVRLGMPWSIMTIAVTLGGRGMRRLLPRRHRLRVPELLLTR